MAPRMPAAVFAMTFLVAGLVLGASLGYVAAGSLADPLRGHRYAALAPSWLSARPRPSDGEPLATAVAAVRGQAASLAAAAAVAPPGKAVSAEAPLVAPAAPPAASFWEASSLLASSLLAASAAAAAAGGAPPPLFGGAASGGGGAGGGNGSAGVPPPVAVVEEHHEALPYWRRHAGKRNGHTLLHFDAHPDFAAPKMQEGLAFGMDSNDVFIAAAALEAVIDRMVWVYPAWDTDGPRHETRDRHHLKVSVAGVGTTRDGSFCMCEADRLATRGLTKASNGWKIMADSIREKLKPSSCIDSDDEPVHTCRIERNLTGVHVSEADLELVDAWLPSLLGSKVILDIDEDHFGQEANRNRLLRSSEKLRKPVATFSCNGAEEAELTATLRGLIDELLLAMAAERRDWDDSRHDTKGQGGGASRALTLNAPAALLNAACGENPQADFDALASALKSLSLLDLRLLRIYGVCFNTSPQTVEGDDRELQVCAEGLSRGQRASNIDTDTQGAEVSLAEEPVEVAARLSIFRGSLAYLRRHLAGGVVSVVTICRSVRDGYTPRRVWHLIEPAVLAALSGPPPSAALTYDPYLLGGPGGWKAWTEGSHVIG